MNNLEKISAELLANFEEIRVMHSVASDTGRLICNECGQVWPCHTTSKVIRAMATGTAHMAASLNHVRVRCGKIEYTLQKIDEYFSAMKTDLAEQVIDLTHQLTISPNIQVFGFTNAFGEVEYQVERVIDEELTHPLWSLMIERELVIRIFAPTTIDENDSFFKNILQLGFASPDVAELLEWWEKLTKESNTYVTQTLPKNQDESCQAIIQLCHATTELRDKEWHYF